MAKKSSPKRPVANRKNSEEAASSSATPWLNAPTEPDRTPAQMPQAETVHMGPAAAPSSTPDRWSDMFDYAPWGGGSTAPVPMGAAPMSPEARARLQASLNRVRGTDTIDSYDNPWGDQPPESGPMSRRDAIRARAAAKRQAEIAEARDDMTGQFEPVDEQVETIAPQNAQSAAPNTDKPSGKPKGGAKRRKKAPATGGAKNISVESLPIGVINVIGDGVVAVVDGSISTGSTIATAMKPVVKMVPPVTVAGLVCVAGAGVFYSYAHALPVPWKI